MPCRGSARGTPAGHAALRSADGRGGYALGDRHLEGLVVAATHFVTGHKLLRPRDGADLLDAFVALGDAYGDRRPGLFAALYELGPCQTCTLTRRCCSSPRPASRFDSPAQPNPTGRAQQACRRSRASCDSSCEHTVGGHLPAAR